MILFGTVLQSCHRNPFSVVATLVLLAQQLVRRSHPFTDEASKYKGLALRHDKSSPLISAQETQSNVKDQENPNRLHFPGSTNKSQITEPGASDLEGDCWMAERELQMLRRLMDATSPTIPMPKHRETDQKLWDQNRLSRFGVAGFS